MSRSPRKNLRMALDALDDLATVRERHPDARAHLEAALGTKLVDEVLAARETIARAVARLNDAGGGNSVTPD